MSSQSSTPPHTQADSASNALEPSAQSVEALGARARKFSAIFAKIPVAASLTRYPGFVIVEVNEAYARTFGYSREELLGRDSLELGVNPDADNRARLAAELEARGSLRDVEVRLRSKSGAVGDYLVNVDLMEIDGQKHVLYTAYDISARKLTELAVQRQNAELAALSKLGHDLSRLVEPAKLMELIHTVVGELLDNRNLYIALYDQANQLVSFPIYTAYGKRITRETRSMGKGLTEYVIRSRAPLFLPHDISNRAAALSIERQGPPARSYMAVPVLVGDQVLGVIGIQDYEHEGAFDNGHLNLLMTIAAQAAIALENARLFAETRRRAEQLQVINDVERVITTILDPDILMGEIAELIRTRLQVDSVGVGLIEGDELLFVADVAAGESAGGPKLRLKIGAGSITGQVAYDGETRLVPDVQLEPAFRPSKAWPDTRSELAVALRTHGGVIGVLNLESNHPNAFAPELVTTVETLASQVAVAIQNARLFAETQRLARTDALTGLSNRRHLKEVAESELSRARRFGHPLTALMLDVDHFKLVNDSQGHAVGDQVLQIVAQCCKRQVRDIDMVARNGGDEFVILLIETDIPGASIYAERLRETLAQTLVPAPRGPMRVTVSVGIAAAELESDSLATLLARADSALYSAKESGRNRVVVA